MVYTSTSEGVPRLLKRNERVKLCKDKVVTYGGVPSSAIDQDEGNDQHHHQQHEEVGVPRDGVAFSPLMVVALWMSILIAASPLAALAFSLAALVAGSRRSALVGLLCSTCHLQKLAAVSLAHGLAAVLGRAHRSCLVTHVPRQR